MEGQQNRVAVCFVELDETPARDVRPWDCPAGRRDVLEVVERFDDTDQGRAVAVGFNRQAMRAKSRRWAVLIDGADSEQVGAGSIVAPATLYAMSAALTA